MKITFIGHSTVLFEGNGHAILTDPNFSDQIVLVKRKGELRYDLSTLPKISAVLISHTHLDHFDHPSFNYFRTDVPVVVPGGSGKKVGRHLSNPIIELNHWANHELAPGLKIHAMPADHKSGFFPLCFRNAAGYVIEIGDKKVYFAGDTTYGTHFRDIGNTFSLNAALLPISCYKPSFIMKHFHMDPGDALQAFLDLKASVMIPIHWGAFRLSMEKMTEPAEWLTKAAAERGISDQIKVLTSGESLII